MRDKLPIPMTAFALTLIATLLWLTEPDKKKESQGTTEGESAEGNGDASCQRAVQGSTSGARLRAAIANCLKTSKLTNPYAITLDAAVTSRGYQLRALEHADIFLAQEVRQKCIDGVLGSARPELRLNPSTKGVNAYYEVVLLQLARLSDGALRSSHNVGCSHAPLSLPRIPPTGSLEDSVQLVGRPLSDDATTQALAACEAQLSPEQQGQDSLHELRLGGPRDGTRAERCEWGEANPYGQCICQGLITWMDTSPDPTAGRKSAPAQAPKPASAGQNPEHSPQGQLVQATAIDVLASPRRFWFGRALRGELPRYFGIWPRSVGY